MDSHHTGLKLTQFRIGGVSKSPPKLMNLNEDHPLKKWFFWLNPYKIEFTITSLIEMHKLPNFGHMTTFTM